MLYLFLSLSDALTGSSQPVVCHLDTPPVLLAAELRPGLGAVSKHTVNGQTAAQVPLALWIYTEGPRVRWSALCTTSPLDMMQYKRLIALFYSYKVPTKEQKTTIKTCSE